MSRYFVHTFGCQMNKLDSELAEASLRRRGFLPAGSEEEADVLLFNTCSVRRHAEDRVYSRLGVLRKAKRKRPDLTVVVMGCMAQRDHENLKARFPQVDVVCGTRMFSKVAELVATHRATGDRVFATDLDAALDYDRDVTIRPNPIQAFVSVMTGCDHRCTFCIVPYTRGAEASRPVADIVGEAERLAADGVREITLVGQNINTYGKGLPGGPDLATLFAALEGVRGLARIRFITSHPGDMTERILGAVGGGAKVCEYLHMPAQSGSSRVLKRMLRRYTADAYRDLVERARRLIPGVEVASDFIVGFPGETDEDFEATVRLVEEVGFQTAYVFKYSERPGTPAARLPDDVPEEVKRERNQRLLAAQEGVSLARNRGWIARTVEVLVEGVSKNDPGRLTGRARGNQIVVFEGDAARLTGRLALVRVAGATPLTLSGEIEEERGTGNGGRGRP